MEALQEIRVGPFCFGCDKVSETSRVEMIVPLMSLLFVVPCFFRAYFSLLNLIWIFKSSMKFLRV